MLLYFFPNECPGICQPRPGHKLGENKAAQNEKTKTKKRCGGGFS